MQMMAGFTLLAANFRYFGLIADGFGWFAFLLVMFDCF